MDYVGVLYDTKSGELFTLSNRPDTSSVSHNSELERRGGLRVGEVRMGIKCLDTPD